MTTVAVRPVGDDVIGAVGAVMEEARFHDHLPRGGTIFLKVNLGWDLFIPGSVTSPGMKIGSDDRLSTTEA